MRQNIPPLPRSISEAEVTKQMTRDLKSVTKDSCKSQLIIADQEYYTSQETGADKLFEKIKEAITRLAPNGNWLEIMNELLQGGLTALVPYPNTYLENSEQVIHGSEYWVFNVELNPKSNTLEVKKTLILQIGQRQTDSTPYTLATTGDAKFLQLSSTWSPQQKTPVIEQKWLSDDEAAQIRIKDKETIRNRNSSFLPQLDRQELI